MTDRKYVTTVPIFLSLPAGQTPLDFKFDISDL